MVEFFYDYGDRASYLLDAHLAAAVDRIGVAVAPRPFELRPSRGENPSAGDRKAGRERPAAGGAVGGDSGDGIEADLPGEARAIGLPLEPPAFVPRSRKAHELALYARDQGCFLPVHEEIFRVLWGEGRDIGRVDVLVELAASAGLEASEAKVVLDVDKYGPVVDAERRRAERLGVEGVPTLLAGARRLEGFHRVEEILTFLENVSEGEMPK